NTVAITSTELQIARVGRMGESAETKCGRLSPNKASPIMPTSATFQKTITERLLKRSPKGPAYEENNRNGAMKQDVTIATIALSSIDLSCTNRTSMSAE